MGRAYRALLIVILVAFGARNPRLARAILFGIVYIAAAVGVSSGAAIALTRRRGQLG